MSRVWYGSLNNRLEENRQFCDEIKVGTGVTEYLWSDRHAYEVTEVKDQKHVKIREYEAKHVGEAFENNWELISNPEMPEISIVKRGKYWYREVEAKREDIAFAYKGELNDEKINIQLWLCHNGFDKDVIMEKGSQKKYHRMNISFGVADYHYDYEF